MSSLVLKQNMFMRRRYGLFKTVVYRGVQINSFIKKATRLLITIIHTSPSESKVLLIKDFFEYLSTTKDIWWLLEGFSDTLKETTIDIASEYPDELRVYFNDFEDVFKNRSF